MSEATRKPKQVLMTHANENPTQTLVISQHGTQFTFDTIFHNPAEALYMLYLLDKQVKDSIERAMRKAKDAQPPTTT